MPNVQQVNFSRRLYAVNAVRSLLHREAARFRFLETGGVLLGYRTDGGDIVVTDATGPGSNAQHRRYSFEPDTAYCQANLVAVYERTGGTISYIGEWHTHPYGSLKPSLQDLRSMLALAEDPATRQQEPVLLIYRPRGRIFRWKWSEEFSASVTDVPSKKLLATDVSWFDQPGGK